MMRCIIFLCLLSSSLSAQQFATKELRHCFHQPHEQHTYTSAQDNTNEIQYLFSGLFLFYKFAISSQDNNRCSFYPSCSEYGMMAVKKKGSILGILATVDRLQRCNGLSPDKYPIDPEKNLLIDNP